jgi:putative FmdB family regulatory protein
MPLYEYQCDTCGRRFERIQKFSDPPVETCPTCSGPVKKLFSAPAIQFKGSGFYITDYAKTGTAGAEGAAAKPATDTAASSGPAKADAPASSTTSEATSSPAKSEPAKASPGSGGKD